jgi:hypothetical protein
MHTRITLALGALGALVALSATADDYEYQHGWKVYQNPQPGSTYSYGQELSPYGPGGSQSYGPGGGQSYGHGGGKSYGPGGGQSYGPGGGNSYGPGGGKNPINPWKPMQ